MMSTPSFALATTSTQLQHPTDLSPGANPGQIDEAVPDMEVDPVLKRTTGAHAIRDDIWSRMVKTRVSTSSGSHATAISGLKGKGRADQSESSGDGRSYLDRLHLARNPPTIEQGPSDAGCLVQSRTARPFSRVVSSVKVGESASAGPSTSAATQPKRASDKIFSGKIFAILAETFGDEDVQFRSIIQKYGGEVCTRSTLTKEEAEVALQAAEFIVVRLMGYVL